jgi:hypothetical protein
MADGVFGFWHGGCEQKYLEMACVDLKERTIPWERVILLTPHSIDSYSRRYYGLYDMF